MIDGQLMVGYQRIRTDSAFQGINAATGEPLMPPFSVATSREVDRACLLADQAAAALGQVDRFRRAQFLEAIARHIDALGDANKEVIAVDQDPAGRQGRRIAKYGSTEVWSKPLSGGAEALALINRGEKDTTIKVRWSELNLANEQEVRDLWRHRDLGHFDGNYSAIVPRHGAILLKLTAAQ